MCEVKRVPQKRTRSDNNNCWYYSVVTYFARQEIFGQGTHYLCSLAIVFSGDDDSLSYCTTVYAPICVH
jgi:hypothetical protein